MGATGSSVESPDPGYEEGRASVDFLVATGESEEDPGLLGNSELFGPVELKFFATGFYEEKFPGLEFPADAHIEFPELLLTFEKERICEFFEEFGFESFEECIETFEGDFIEFSFFYGDIKEEWGIIKAFPPLFENPLCTLFPAPEAFEDLFFEPLELTTGTEEEEEETEIEIFMFFNCNEFGEPIVPPVFPTQPQTFTNLNT
ncbi:MAG: hypothetical protein IH949_00355, partial [Bacteroidetes bacterium]|nr:hypothetical protein [Bacteroidota bacterium]